MTLELRHITKQAGAETHIYETSLTLAREGFNVLLGTTGSGKTTLMQLMAGLERPSRGELWFDGKNVTGVSPQKRNVSFVHQFFINYPAMSVYDNIASPLRVARMDRAEIDRRVGEAAELLKLSPMLNRRPGELSGGQQQRTALARALVKDSTAVFLDEPLANLDFKLREELRDELPKLFAAKGAVVVYATSEPHEALLLGGHTALLHEGRVTQFGPTAEIYRRPANLRAASVFSDPPMNVADVEKRGDQVILAGMTAWTATGPAAGLADGRYTIGLRPHQVTPHAASASAVKVAGQVLVTELSGSESVAHFDFGPAQNQAPAGSLPLVWVSQAHGVHAYEVGSAHDFYLEPAAMFYFAPDGALVAAPGG